MFDRLFGLQIQAAIGKRIRGDIHNPHHIGALSQGQLSRTQVQMSRCILLGLQGLF